MDEDRWMEEEKCLAGWPRLKEEIPVRRARGCEWRCRDGGMHRGGRQADEDLFLIEKGGAFLLY